MITLGQGQQEAVPNLQINLGNQVVEIQTQVILGVDL